MKLSILEQSLISADQSEKEALVESMKLAKVGESLGYERFWMTEHHDLSGLACSAPEVMLSYIGAHTESIRLGTGAVLLPHYKPYKVAEVHNLLATLFPGRIDVGIGRAPGGSAEVTNALSDNFLQNVYKMPELTRDLLHFLEDNDSKISATPLPDLPPVPWLLGTSEKSALLAAENGVAYAFGQFMSDADGSAIIQKYVDAFSPRKEGETPQVIVTVSAFCAETEEQAAAAALPSLIWQLQKNAMEGLPSIRDAAKYQPNDKEKERLEKMKQKMIIGDPQQVKEELMKIQSQTQADEIMIITPTHFENQVESYRLIAESLGK